MDIRYSCNQKDFKRYTTEEMRDEMVKELREKVAPIPVFLTR